MDHHDATIVHAMNKLTGAGILTTLASWGLEWNVLIGLVGLVVAIISVGISWIYRHKTYKLLVAQSKKEIPPNF